MLNITDELNEAFTEWRGMYLEARRASIAAIKYGVSKVEVARVPLPPEDGYCCYSPGVVSVTLNDGTEVVIDREIWASV